MGDMASSALASTVEGAEEVHPLGIFVFPIKHGLILMTDDWECEKRQTIHSVAAGSSFGASMNNLMVFLFTAAPELSIPIGIVSGFFMQKMAKEDCPVVGGGMR